MFEKLARGVYVLPEKLDDEIFDLQNRFKGGVFLHETSLFLWDITDRTLGAYRMTFPATYNLTNPKAERVECIQCKKDWYDLGIIEIFTLAGNRVKVYSMERTLCNILCPHS